MVRLRPLTWRERLGLGESRSDREARERQVEREAFARQLEAQQEATRELLRTNASTQAELLKAVAASSNVFAEYLKLITSAGKPKLRIQDDATEAFHEAKAAQARPRELQEWKSIREVMAEGPFAQPTPIISDLRNDLGL